MNNDFPEGHKREVKRKHPRPGFELRSLIPFRTTITVTLLVIFFTFSDIIFLSNLIDGNFEKYYMLLFPHLLLFFRNFFLSLCEFCFKFLKVTTEFGSVILCFSALCAFPASLLWGTVFVECFPKSFSHYSRPHILPELQDLRTILSLKSFFLDLQVFVLLDEIAFLFHDYIIRFRCLFLCALILK